MKASIAVGVFLLVTFTCINAYVVEREKVKRQTSLSISTKTVLPRKETFLVLDRVTVVRLTGKNATEHFVDGTVRCNFNTSAFSAANDSDPDNPFVIPGAISVCHLLKSLELKSTNTSEVVYQGRGQLYTDLNSVLFIDESSSPASDYIKARRPNFALVVEVSEYIIVVRSDAMVFDQLVLNLDNTEAPDGIPDTTDDGIRLTGANCMKLQSRDAIDYSNEVLKILRGPTELMRFSQILELEVLKSERFGDLECLDLRRFSGSSSDDSFTGNSLLCVGTSHLGGTGVAFFTDSPDVISTIEESIVSEQLDFTSGANNTAQVTGKLVPNRGMQFLEINEGSQFFTFENAAELQQVDGVVSVRDRFGNIIRQFGALGSGTSLVYFDTRVTSTSSTESLATVAIPEGGINLIASEVGGSRMLFAYSARNSFINEGIEQLRSGIVIEPRPPISFQTVTNNFGVVTLWAGNVFILEISSSMSVGVGISQCSIYSMDTITVLNNCDSTSPVSRINNIGLVQVHDSATDTISTSTGARAGPILGGGQWFFSGGRAFYTDSASLISRIQNAINNAPRSRVDVVSVDDSSTVALRTGSDNFLTFGDMVNTTTIDANQALLYAEGDLFSADVIRVPRGGSLVYLPSLRNIQITGPAGSGITPLDVSTDALLAQAIPGGDAVSFSMQTTFPGGGTLYIGDSGSIYLLDDQFDMSALNTLSGLGGLSTIIASVPSLDFFDGRRVQMFIGSSMNAIFGPGTLYGGSEKFFYTTDRMLMESIQSNFPRIRPLKSTYSSETGNVVFETEGGAEIASLPVQSNTVQIPSGEGISLVFSMDTLLLNTPDENATVISSGISMITFFDGLQATMTTSPNAMEFPGGGLLLYDTEGGTALYVTEPSTIRRINQALARAISTFAGPFIPITRPGTVVTEEDEVDAGFGQSLTVHEGATVNLRCTAGNSNPPATFSFFRRSITGSDTSNMPVTMNNSEIITNGPNDVTLRLIQVLQESEDTIEYMCTASNVVSSASRITRVTVLPGVPATIDNGFIFGRTSPGEVAITARSDILDVVIPTLKSDTDTIIDDPTLLSDKVTIRCRGLGSPTPSITWSRKVNFGTEMEVNTSLSTFNISSRRPGESLLTVALGPDDTDCFEYICRASNGIGEAIGSALVCPERFSIQGNEIAGSCSATCQIGVQRSVFDYIREFNGSSPTVQFDELPPGLVKPIVRFCSINVPCPMEVINFIISQIGDCSEFCGVGIQQGEVNCVRYVEGMMENATILDDKECFALGRAKPTGRQNCNTFDCPHYVTGDFDTCSRTCQGGTQMREVSCEGFFSILDGVVEEEENSTVLADEICGNFSKEQEPEAVRGCNENIVCPVRFAAMAFQPCDQFFCQQRTIVCVNFDASDPTEQWLTEDEVCEDQGFVRPHSVRSCGGGICQFGRWNSSVSMNCSAPCGIGIQTFDVICVNATSGTEIEEGFCNSRVKPKTQQPCHIRNCPGRCDVEPGVCRFIRQFRMCKSQLAVIPQCCRSCPLQATPIPNL